MSNPNKVRDVDTRNEFDRSYLLFSMEEGKREEYTFRMVTQNEIPGVLNCRVRYIEDTPYYSYEITSKRSLLQKYSDQKIHYKDLKELFYAINEILKKAADYLLEKEGFLLEPEYIFSDLENEDLYCVYLPEVSGFEDNSGRYRSLADFLLDRADHKDEHAVNAVYQFYKMSKEEFFSFDAFIGFMEKEDLMLQAEEKRKEEKNSLLQAGFNMKEDEAYGVGKSEDLEMKEQKSFHWKIPCVLSIAGILLTISVLFIPRAFVLYLLMPGLTMMAVSVILWGMALYRWFKGDEQEEMMKLEAPVTVEEYFDDMLDNETVYFDEELTLRLKWKEGHFSKEYALMTFPVTVGKWRESVQMYIEDASISRLHARFTQQDEMVILQDLDSTNGTRVNGKKLAAGEEAVIRRNDEIQFGKIIVNVV